jgi:GT2 family glycosyltransferase
VASTTASASSRAVSPWTWRDDSVVAAVSTAVSVVIATQNRCAELARTLSVLAGLPEQPPVVVVDNGSSDGTADHVRDHFEDVELVALSHNAGAAGRTAGVRRATTPYVAFSDDDSWWDPGALTQAAAVLDGHPSLGLIAGQIRTEPDGELDPVCELMANSPLAAVDGVGPRILGFVACGAVVRREAYLAVGGFHPRFGIGGEEDLLALDLSTAGWDCYYVETVVARHQPSTSRDPAARRRRQLRNALWTSWLRRPLRQAMDVSVRLLREAGREDRPGALEALRGLPWVLRQRGPVDPATAAQLTELDRQRVTAEL